MLRKVVMACMTVLATGARNHTYPLWQGNHAVLMGAKRANCTGWRLGAVDYLRRSASMFTILPILISAMDYGAYHSQRIQGLEDDSPNELQPVINGSPHGTQFLPQGA